MEFVLYALIAIVNLGLIIFAAIKLQEKLDAKKANSPKGIEQAKKQAKLTALSKICYNCKGSINTQDKTCPNCGVETYASLVEQSWKKLTIKDIIRNIVQVIFIVLGAVAINNGNVGGSIAIIIILITVVITELVGYIKKSKDKDRKLLISKKVEEIYNNFDLDSVEDNENQKIVSTPSVQNVIPVQNAAPVQTAEEFRFCGNCGVKMKKSLKYCVACGQKVE